MTLFYFNKAFYSRMSFDSNSTNYESTFKYLFTTLVNNIADRMADLLEYDRANFGRSREVIRK